MRDRAAVRVKDAADDLRRLLITAGVVLVAFSFGATMQSVFIYGAPIEFGSILEGAPSFILRTVVNLLSVVVVLALCGAVRLPELSPIKQILMTVLIASGVTIVRFGVQRLVGIYPHPSMQTSLAEMISAGVTIVLSIALGMAQMVTHKRLRTQERAAAEQRLRATDALVALSEEELRVRRTVAEGLHGGLQSRLVMVQIQLDHLRERWRAAELDDSDLGVLDQVSTELDAVREDEVRQVSHFLYPAGVEISVAYALRRLVRRVPSQIAIDAHIDEAFDDEAHTGDEPENATVAWRVALLRAAEEGISNALRHGGAGQISIGLHARMDDDPIQVVLVVDDDGVGMPETGATQRGLARSEQRLKSLGGIQRLETSPWGGVRLIAELPLHSQHPRNLTARS